MKRHITHLLLLGIFALLPLLTQLHAESIDLSGTGWFLWRDKEATWKNDPLFLPPVDLTKVPLHPPTGGWEKLSQGLPVSVPGTAEEYLGNGQGNSTMVDGVTWWTKEVTIPVTAEGKTIRLLLDSTRLRAEIFVNHKLVAYDIIANTPFEANLTGLVKPGEKAQIAVRITNPGGNFFSGDVGPIKWGEYTIPASHGFGGITGGVHLAITDSVYVDDLYIQNSKVPTTVMAIATIKNSTAEIVSGSAEVVIHEKNTGKEVFRKQLGEQIFAPGESVISCPVSVPEARLWDLDHPNLYQATFSIAGSKAVDTMVRSFGFRWFSPEGIGSNALLRLNGKRVFLRTAISWGFWPVNGIFPTPELAKKQIQAAKDFGMNMLNFHRCIGNPIVFDKADEMGLLYFEEPGGYTSAGKDPFAQAISREKLLRMVKRDRSHPSLIIYNMINEQWNIYGADKDPTLFDIHRKDLMDAHALDPSRVMVYTSAWAGRVSDPKNDPAKMNMQPFDAVVHMNGWSDYHRAGGPEVWKQSFYQSPEHHFSFTKNRAEIVYWGEDGAMSSPARLGLMKQQIDAAPRLGWDSQVYLDWYKVFDDFLTEQHLRTSFPTVDDLCKAMGAISIEHQGRKFEDTRICDFNDGYAINGWEDEITDNHSSMVDIYRNPKADPAIMAYYNQPLYIAVKPRRQISTFPGSVTVDFFLLNEKDLKGRFTLRIRATTTDGKETFSKDLPVIATGGDLFSQIIAEAVEIPLTAMEGMTTITASLVNTQNETKASGHDQVLAVNGKSVPVSGKGAVFENGNHLRNFLKQARGMDVPLFDNTQGKLDWILVTKFPNEAVLIPKEALLQPDGKTQGIKTSFFAGGDFKRPFGSRVDETLDLNISSMATPDAKVTQIDNYSVRWEGSVIPPVTGEYTFTLNYQDSARLWIDGKPLLDDSKDKNQRRAKIQSHQYKLTLTGGKPVSLLVELLEKNNGARMQLLWQTPVPESVSAAQVLERAKRDGTTILIMDQSAAWLDAVGAATSIPQGKPFEVRMDWYGGQYFVKEHPLFAGLPVNQGMNWPYQSVVGGKRMGLDLHGGELIAGAWNSWPMHLGSAVSIFPLGEGGEGKVLLSTLDIISQLDNPDSSAEVARRLLSNFLSYASHSPITAPTGK